MPSPVPWDSFASHHPRPRQHRGPIPDRVRAHQDITSRNWTGQLIEVIARDQLVLAPFFRRPVSA